MARRGLMITAMTLAGTAVANGRFPATSSVAVQQGHSDHVLVGATFGPVISTDNGSTWQWICDQSVGNLTPIDPSFLWMANGTILAAAWEGLLVSSDTGCNWSAHPFFAPTNPAGPHQGTSGIAQSSTDPNTLYVTTSRSGVANGLYVSHDAAATFAPTGLSSSSVFYGSVVVAPSDPARLYVSGWWFAPADGGTAFSGWIFESQDTGASFQAHDQGIPQDGLIQLLGVSPANPDVVFGYVLGYAAGVSTPVSQVFRSNNGGQTLTTVLTVNDRMRNFAISDDGQTVWIASLNTLFRSADAGQTFTALPSPTQNACVQRNGNTLYACGWPWADNWAVGSSADQGATFTKLFNLTDMHGLMACPPQSGTATLCAGQWDQLAATLGITVDAGVPPPTYKGGCRCGPVGFDPSNSPWEALFYIALTKLLWARRPIFRPRRDR